MLDYCEYDVDLELPYTYEFVEEVPKDNVALVECYGDLLDKTLNRYNKVRRNQEDLAQEIWSHLIKVGFLDKFKRGAARRLPSMLTGEEAAEFLGLSWEAFQDFLVGSSLGSITLPVEGESADPWSLWDTASICELDYQGGIPGQEPGRRKRPVVSAQGFKGYFQRAVHNAFANICRTHDRHYKEQLLAPSTIVVRKGDSYRPVAQEESEGSWESYLTAVAMIDPESVLDLVASMREARIDPCTQEGLLALDALCESRTSLCRNHFVHAS